MILVAILVVGALVRGLYLREIIHNLDFTHPQIDAHYHDYWARGLATGDWSDTGIYADPQIPTTPYFRAPGYPYFLALVYLATGGSYLAARIVQMLLGLLSCLLAFKLAKRWFGSVTALITAALMSVYWVFIYFEGELLEPPLLVPMVLGFIYVLGLSVEKITFRRSFLAGILLGLNALVRANTLVFGPVALAWAYWIAKRRNDWMAFRTAALGLIIGAVIAITPATIRNCLIGGECVLIATSGGINLFLGNNPYADGYTPCAPGIQQWTSHDYPRIVEALSQQAGRPLSHSEVSRIFSQNAIAFMKKHPLWTAKLTAKKALLFWGPREVSNEKEDEIERAHSRILSKIPGNFATVLSLFLVGATLMFSEFRRAKKEKGDGSGADRQRFEIAVLLILFVVVYFASYLPFFVAGRFRVPIIPFLLLFGAYGLSRIGMFAVRRDFGLVAGWIGVLCLLYLVASANPTGYRPMPDRWHYARGVAYMNQGNDKMAEVEFRQALKIKPQYPEAHVNLGIVLRNRGKLDAAIQEYREALRLQPNLGRAHNNLAVALYDKGQYREAWEQVYLAMQDGISPSSDFLDALKEKMSPPDVPAE